MTNKPGSKIKPSGKPLMTTAVAQTAESERVELLAAIACLRALLYRFAPLLNSESLEIAIQSQAAVEKIANEIHRVFADQHAQTGRDHLENWEKEGGRIDQVSL